ncbi:hypothetical protein [Roseospira visakhapatnamensis]|uniref:Uncharacterized protein n=1 Tax=Roseospira visakhapatnamensis TaxID=390880 RepID=A0A7W6RBF5_9PROT|nr:hypothetical protein [Roseospira visakhapatnamensis]MBB4265418.1 hypothetical protein [Roseospira visakhapatnamensis]
MTISPMLFICLFFASFGVFLMGASAIWWVSLQAKATKETGNGSTVA